MKKLITAIDFSKCSLHALEYTINLANTVDADVEMIWVDTHHDSETELAAANRELRMEAKRQFEEIIERYSADLKTGTLNYKIRKGKVYQEVANQAKYDDASMILTGSHGVSGYEKFWVGSNTYRIVSSAPCPVLTIRLDYAFKPVINRIILPIDSTLETRQKVPYTVRLAKFYNSIINVIAVYGSSVKAIQRKVDQYAEQTAVFVHQHGIKVELNVIEADNITNAIIQHAEQTDADLISIMTEQESSPANLLLGPYAQQMINNSPIPVLTTQATEIQKITNAF